MNLAHPHFAEPHWLWLALVGPLLLFGLQRYSGWQRERQLKKLASEHFLGELTRSHSPFRRELKNIMLLAALAAAGLALARPQWGQQSERSEAFGDDVIFIVDCSRSMLAADVRPNRLQRSKLAVLDFMHRHGHSRLGLVAFAGQAFLQCPLTFDYSSFEDALMALDDKTIPVPGTDIAGALDEAVRALDKDERRKLFVLLTDGEDLEKGGVKMAEKLAKEGVIIFTIGVGTPGGAEIQLVNEQGHAELLRDSKGQVVTSHLDETTLKSIAEVTKGAYYPLGMLGEGLAKVRLALEGQTHWAGTAPNRKFGVDRFHWFVAGAIGLLVFESLTGTRRRSARRAATVSTGTRTVAGALLVILIFCFATGQLGAATAEPSREEKRTKAPPPSTPREFYNAGTDRLNAGDLREAETMLEIVLSSQEERWQGPALYDLGHVRFAEGAEALKKAASGEGLTGASKPVSERTGKAITQADEALATEELQKLIAAYQNGRGQRKETKAVLAAIKDALKQHAATLNKWQRSSGDFKSAVELNPRDTDAQRNADLVDRHIAKLIDTIQQMQQMAAMLGKQNQDLGEKMKQLKGKIPADQMPPGAAGDSDEEEDQPFGKEPGQKEGESREGKEMQLSPEQAGWLLEAFKLDSERKLPMSGMGKEGKPRDPNKPTW